MLLALACTGPLDSAPVDTATDTADSADTGGTADTTDTATTSALLARIGALTVSDTLTGTESLTVLADDGAGDALCTISAPVTSTAARTDCTACLWAFDVLLGDTTVDVDLACTDAGVDASTIPGNTRAMGFAEEYLGHSGVLLVEVDGTWAPVAFADWTEPTLSYRWDLEILEW